jgi:hypothetical protein
VSDRVRPGVRRDAALFAAVLQGVALLALGIELVFLVLALLAQPSDYVVVLALGLAAVVGAGIWGFRRWLRGGRPAILYAVDAFPLLFIATMTENGPAAFQTPVGLVIAAIFAAPMVALYLAGRR